MARTSSQWFGEAEATNSGGVAGVGRDRGSGARDHG